MNLVDSVSIIWNVSIFHLRLEFNSFFSFILFSGVCLNEILSVILCYLYNLKNVKNTHREELLLLKLHALAVALTSHSPAVCTCWSQQRNSRTLEVWNCSKLIKTSKPRQWCSSGVFLTLRGFVFVVSLVSKCWQGQ